MVSRSDPRPKAIFYITLPFFIVTFLWPFLQILVPDEHTRLVISDLTLPAFTLLATVALMHAAHRSLTRDRRTHKAWGFMAVALLFWLLGEVTWSILELGMQQEPFPSLADAFYLSYYVLFSTGMLVMPFKPFTRTEWLKSALDLSMVFLASGILFWNFLIGPTALQVGGESRSVILFSLAYPVTALVFLSSLLILASRKIELGQKPLLFLILGATLAVLTDVIYGYQSIRGAYMSGGTLDVGWLAALLCIALGGFIYASPVQPVNDQRVKPKPKITAWRWASFLPYLFLIPTYGLLVWGHYADLPMQFSLLASALGVIMALVVVRQIIALLENQNLNVKLRDELGERERAERTLRSVNVELQQTNSVLRQEIIERQKAETALRVSEERYALAARGANDGLWDWNLKTDAVYYSDRWHAMIGYEDGDIGSSPGTWFSRVHPDDIRHLELEISNHLDGVSDLVHIQYRMMHRDGSYRWMLSRGLVLRDQNGKPHRIAGSQTDITDQKRAEEQLLQNAFFDALTGLPNRALFLDRLNQAIQRAREESEGFESRQFAVLFMDFDHFKLVNDSLGHPVGDKLLIEAARRLGGCVRATDTVARLGGDEFVVLLGHIEGMADILRIVDSVQNALRLPFMLGSEEVFTSVSIGIVMSQSDYLDAGDMLRDADIALYRAKATGRARYVLFEPSMQIQAAERLRMETDIRRALERQELRVHYQPIISLSSSDIIAFEALVRWQHPKLGLIHPDEFLPIAEEAGLITAIDKWVLREACEQLYAWQEQFPALSSILISVSVNLSSRHFMQPDLIESVRQVLHETGLEPRNLRLEISESAIMGDSKAAIHVLGLLRELGVQVQIDDFGTGYSSLSYLQQFPIHHIKIDRSFIERIGRDHNSAHIVKTIVRLAHDLGMNTTAEGVETKDQLESLKQLACEYGQGYYISHPLNAQSMHDLLAQRIATKETKL